MSEKLQFKISSALKDVIGKDLIIDENVAIFELVKNSFDAFADNVIIDFEFKKNDSKIFIVDNGKGMSKEDLINKWLFVAFSAKKEGTEDPEKKIYSGYKGIGRFSCDRLGSILRIQTKTKKDKYVHTLNINWDDFEKNSKQEFISIDIDYEKQPSFILPKEFPALDSGLILEISNLRDEKTWSRSKLIKLRRSLQKFIDPFGSERKIDILCKRELENDINDEKKYRGKNETPTLVNGVLKNDIFFTLENKTTKIKAEISKDGFLFVSLIDRGLLVYSTKEEINNIYPNLLDSEFYIELSYLNRSAKLTFARAMGIPSVQYGSLFLLRNGFRVYPVGEESNDYWGFDRRHQQGFKRSLGSRDLLGFVKISGDEDKFRESSSRNQGLIETEASKELNDCVKYCMMKLETYVVDITWKDLLDKDFSTSERMFLDNNRHRIIQLIEKLSKSKNVKVVEYNKNLITILNNKSSEFEVSLSKLRRIAEKLNDKNLLIQVIESEKILEKARKSQKNAEKLAQKEKQAREETEKKLKQVTGEKDNTQKAFEEELKRNLFLTSSKTRDKDLLEGFIHQIILYAADAKTQIENVLQLSPEQIKKMDVEKLFLRLTELYSVIEKIISTSRFATTANFRLESSMITEDLNEFITQYVEKISQAYNAHSSISIKVVSDNKQFIKKFNPIEIGIILENLISNSKKAKSSEIVFYLRNKTSILEIEAVDNGNGLDDSILDRSLIFEKGFTRTYGSGLGLYYCKKQLELWGGDIKLSESQPKKGLSLLIKMVK